MIKIFKEKKHFTCRIDDIQHCNFHIKLSLITSLISKMGIKEELKENSDSKKSVNIDLPSRIVYGWWVALWRDSREVRWLCAALCVTLTYVGLYPRGFNTCLPAFHTD